MSNNPEQANPQQTGSHPWARPGAQPASPVSPARQSIHTWLHRLPLLAALGVLAACSTVPESALPPANRGTPPVEAQGNAAQNVAIGSLAGAVAGCALAKLVGEKCADGAAIGAVIGAAIGYSTWSEKVGSAQSVNAEAKNEGLAVPDNELKLKQYTLSPSSNTIQAGGGTLMVVGDIKLYGHSPRTPEVVQAMWLYKANGESLSDTPQIARIEKVDGAGHYRAVGVYKIPRGMEQGVYQVKSTLSIDGKVVARRDARFQVALQGPLPKAV